MNYVLDVYKKGEMQGTKVFSSPSNLLNKWVARPKNTVECLPLSGAITITKNPKITNRSINSIGCLADHGGDVQHNNFSFILTSIYGQPGSWSITRENFEQSMLCFIPRKLTQANWLNDKDEYSVPDLEHPDFNQFKYDAIVWALFNGSNQSSSIKATYKDKDWDIKNEFFWLSREFVTEIEELPSQVGTQADKSTERFIATWLEENRSRLSPDIIELLDLAKELVRVSAWARPHADPRFQLMRWDAGWYQIRMGLFGTDTKFEKTQIMIDTMQKFQDSYKALTARLRPMIYELGYLPKENV